MIGPGGALNLINDNIEIIDGKIDIINGKVDRNYNEIEVIDRHFHNREIWFGNGAVEDSLVPYTLVSGNNDFGSEVLILNSTDTPVDAGMIKFDPHKIEVVEVDTDSEYYLRIIWGSGTVGEAETAKQYSTFPVTPSGVGSNISGDPIDTKVKRINCGIDKVWMKCKNVSNLAEIYVQLGLHEYPE